MAFMFDESLAKKDDYIYQRTEKTPVSGIRFHNGFEFLYVYSGSIELSIDGDVCALRQGDGALVFPDVVHSYRSLCETESYCCIFSPSYVPEFGKRRRLTAPESCVFALPDGSKIIDMLRDSTNLFAIKGILYYILSFVAGNEDDAGGDMVEVAQKVMDYIEQNFSENITLTDISLALNYNYNYLSALINRIFKMSFSKLLNKYRVYTAEQLLKARKYKIIDISERCGYSSLRSFNRNFKKITGKTPSEFLADSE